MNARVGVGCFVLNREGTKFVTGLRKGSHGNNMIQLPGGHLELGESFEDCARRETLEETNLEIEEIHFMTTTNDVFGSADSMKHYVTIFMVARVVKDSEEPTVMEPEKCESWQWSSWEELKALPREELFLPLQNLISTRPELSPSTGLDQLQ